MPDVRTIGYVVEDGQEVFPLFIGVSKSLIEADENEELEDFLAQQAADHMRVLVRKHFETVRRQDVP